MTSKVREFRLLGVTLRKPAEYKTATKPMPKEKIANAAAVTRVNDRPLMAAARRFDPVSIVARPSVVRTDPRLTRTVNTPNTRTSIGIPRTEELPQPKTEPVKATGLLALSVLVVPRMTERQRAW